MMLDFVRPDALVKSPKGSIELNPDIIWVFKDMFLRTIIIILALSHLYGLITCIEFSKKVKAFEFWI